MRFRCIWIHALGEVSGPAKARATMCDSTCGRRQDGSLVGPSGSGLCIRAASRPHHALASSEGRLSAIALHCLY